MNFIDKIFILFRERRAQSKAKQSEMLCGQLSERIQVKEFQGRMYIAVDGVPMIDTEDLRTGIVDELSEIRNTIIKYKMR